MPTLHGRPLVKTTGRPDLIRPPGSAPGRLHACVFIRSSLRSSFPCRPTVQSGPQKHLLEQDKLDRLATVFLQTLRW